MTTDGRPKQTATGRPRARRLTIINRAPGRPRTSQEPTTTATDGSTDGEMPDANYNYILLKVRSGILAYNNDNARRSTRPSSRNIYRRRPGVNGHASFRDDISFELKYCSRSYA